MKKITISSLVLLSGLLFSQVGINTDKPKATLDIVSSPSNSAKNDGILIPKLTGDQLKAKDALYGVDQEGVLVFITQNVTPPYNGKTRNVNTPGFYYYDRLTSTWLKVNDQASNGLQFTGSDTRLGGALIQPTTISGITAANTLNFQSATSNAADSYITVGTVGGTSGGMYLGNSSHGIKRGFPNLGVDNNLGLYTQAGNLYLSTDGAKTGEFVLSDNGNVGINMEQPKATLDIASSPTNTTKTDGVIAPRLTREQLTNKGNSLYGTEQRGAIIYITDVTGGNVNGQRVNVTSAGYYYFDGALWQKMLAGIADTTVDAWVDDSAGSLVKIGTKSDGTPRDTNTDIVATDNGRIGIGTTTPTHGLTIWGSGGNDDDVAIRSYTNSNISSGLVQLSRFRGTRAAPTAVQADDVLGGILFNAYNANNVSGNYAAIHSIVSGAPSGEFVPSSLIFRASNSANPLERMRITHEGNVGINTTNPNTKLHIIASAPGTAFTLADGSQGSGKVLVSDASGNAKWEEGRNAQYQKQQAALSGNLTMNNSSTGVPIAGLSGFTSQSKGKYMINFHYFLRTDGSPADRAFYFRTFKNGSSTISDVEVYGYSGTMNGHIAGTIPIIVDLNAGDIITYDFRNQIVNTLTFESAFNARNYMEVVYLGL